MTDDRLTVYKTSAKTFGFFTIKIYSSLHATKHDQILPFFPFGLHTKTKNQSCRCHAAPHDVVSSKPDRLRMAAVDKKWFTLVDLVRRIIFASCGKLNNNRNASALQKKVRFGSGHGVRSRHGDRILSYRSAQRAQHIALRQLQVHTLFCLFVLATQTLFCLLMLATDFNDSLGSNRTETRSTRELTNHPQTKSREQ